MRIKAMDYSLLNEEWLRSVAEKNGISCTLDANNGSECFDCDFESLRNFAYEVSANFTQLNQQKQTTQPNRAR